MPIADELDPERERDIDDIVARWERADAERAQARSNGPARDTEPAPPPLPYVDLALDLVARSWLVFERIPLLNVSLVSGEGAIGKSVLVMQLAAAVVLARDWIGPLPESGPVLYVVRG